MEKKLRKFTIDNVDYDAVYETMDDGTIVRVYMRQCKSRGTHITYDFLFKNNGNLVHSLDYSMLKILKDNELFASGLSEKLNELGYVIKTVDLNNKIKVWKNRGMLKDSRVGYGLDENGKGMLEEMDKELEKLSKPLQLSLNS